MARLTSLFCGEKMVNVWRSGTVRPDGAWCSFVIVDTENATVGRRAAASQARRTRYIIVGRGRMRPCPAQSRPVPRSPIMKSSRQQTPSPPSVTRHLLPGHLSRPPGYLNPLLGLGFRVIGLLFRITVGVIRVNVRCGFRVRLELGSGLRGCNVHDVDFPVSGGKCPGSKCPAFAIASVTSSGVSRRRPIDRWPLRPQLT